MQWWIDTLNETTVSTTTLLTTTLPTTEYTRTTTEIVKLIKKQKEGTCPETCQDEESLEISTLCAKKAHGK